MGRGRAAELVSRALQHAVATRRPAAGLMHHSDRGSQYGSGEYQHLLHRHRMQISMSRRGNCYDNAPIESFWGSLHTELVHHRKYPTRRQAECEVVEHIDIFHHHQRRQARLGYRSPAALMQQFVRQQQ